MKVYRNRSRAGQLLGQKIIEKFPKLKNTIILALPRGGVVIGAEISKVLNLPLDIIVTRKICAPLSPEYAVAAVSENEVVLNPREDIDKKYLENETDKERQEIKRRLKEYRGNRSKIDLKNKIVFLVDDGLATGLTMEVALLEVKRYSPLKIVIAVPVAPPETIEKLRQKVDDLIVLDIESMFFSVGQFYENFPQVTDEEVKELLK